jgi:hypothetical protein
MEKFDALCDEVSRLRLDVLAALEKLDDRDAELISALREVVRLITELTALNQAWAVAYGELLRRK